MDIFWMVAMNMSGNSCNLSSFWIIVVNFSAGGLPRILLCGTVNTFFLKKSWESFKLPKILKHKPLCGSLKFNFRWFLFRTSELWKSIKFSSQIANFLAQVPTARIPINKIRRLGEIFLHHFHLPRIHNFLSTLESLTDAKITCMQYFRLLILHIGGNAGI